MKHQNFAGEYINRNLVEQESPIREFGVASSGLVYWYVGSLIAVVLLISL